MELPQRRYVIQSFLKIRWLQFGRILGEVGVVRVLVLLLFCLPLAASVPRLFAAIPWLGAMVWFAFVLSVHISRKDDTFLRLYFDHFAKGILLVEYQLLGFPATILLIYKQNNWAAVVLLVALCILPYIKSGIKKGYFIFRSIPFFPVKAFELRAGLRSNYISIVISVLIGTIFAKFIFVPLLSIFILTIILASFNLLCESALMVRTFNNTPNRFLLDKIRMQSAVIFLLLLPINTAFLLFHVSYWHLLLAVNTMAFTIYVLSICFKYAMYIPGEELKGNNLLIGLAIGCFFIVFLAPVPFVLLVLYYAKALKNLNRFLYVGS